MRIWLSLLCVAALACDGGDKPAGAEQAAEAPVAPAPAPAEKAAEAEAPKPVEAAGPVAEDPTFELKLQPAGTYKAGELGRVDLTLTPRGEYHVNQDYPMSVELTAPEGLTLPKASFAKADAAKFDDKQAVFEMPLTPGAAGEQKLQAKVRFAVCTEETCVPDERTLALALTVE